MPRSRLHLVWALSATALVGCAESSTEPTPGIETCESATPITLGVGQSAVLSGASAGSICVGANELGEEFVLVATSLSEAGSTQLQVEAQNVGTVSGPPAPTPSAAAPVAASIKSRALVPDAHFHASLRRREQTELSFPTEPTPRARRAPAATAITTPQVGQMLSLNAQTEEACENPLTVSARVEAVSEKAIVVADVDNPIGGFTSAQYEEIADIFTNLIAPIVEAAFGLPSDLDQNGRTIIFFTKEVNAIESEEEGAFTSGFFYSRDLFPTTAAPPLAPCPTSNQAEILYMFAPDPTGAFGEAFTAADVMRFTITNIGHELQHLVNASVRLFGGTGAVKFEETWLNEALSHLTEELLFYAVSGLEPGQDIGIDDLNLQALDAINQYQLFNFLRLRLFFEEPSTNSPFADDDFLATRGAAWSFLRYSSDRLGIGDDALFRGLVTSPLTGLANLSAEVGGSGVVFNWLGDWSTSLYVDNRVPGIPARFQDLSWDNPSLFLAASLDPPYIATTDLGFNPAASRTITAGGSAYFRFSVARDQVGSLGLGSSNGPPPATLRVTVMRTR